MSKAKTATGPFGFPMPDKLAKAAEEALKRVPKDVRDRFKTTVTQADGKKQTVDGYARRTVETKAMDFVDGEHADVSVITSDSVDRDREVVVARGLDFSQFQKNPVVTFAHSYYCLPVGKCLWVKMEQLAGGGECWKAKTKYTARPGADLLPEGSEWFPDIVWHYIREGELRGKSIGFIPMEYHDPTPDEVRANPNWADAKWGIIGEAMVLEYAVAPVQANPDALVESVAKMKAKGFSSKTLTDALGLVIPEDVPAVADLSTKEMPITKTVLPFVAPETIKLATERAAQQALQSVSAKVSEQLLDGIYRKMGKV
jgi:hypothetical protein